MVWNEALPAGTEKLSAVDDLIRDNNSAIETIVNKEHSMTTGGDLTGLHKFGVGDDSARTAAITTLLGGRIWFNDDEQWLRLQVYNATAGAWESLDDDIPRVNVAQVWESGQLSPYTQITSAATLNWDVDDSNMFYVNLAHNATLAYPTSTLTLLAANVGGNFTISVKQTGSFTLAFASGLNPAWGSQPPIDTVLNSYTLIHITIRQNETAAYRVEHTGI